jgi:hypothetical protein
MRRPYVHSRGRLCHIRTADYEDDDDFEGDHEHDFRGITHALLVTTRDENGSVTATTDHDYDDDNDDDLQRSIACPK